MSIDIESARQLVDLHKSIALAHAQIAAVYAAQISDAESGAAAVVAEPDAPALVAATAAPVVKVQSEAHVDAGKPDPIRITVAGFDMAKLGMSNGKSSIPWENLIGHPPFQMFMDEAKFPNPDGKDAAELAADFIIEQSKVKAELAFYAEYATWFKKKALWPAETPLGHPIRTE